MKNYGRAPAWTKKITFQILITDSCNLLQPPVYDNPTTTEAKYAIPPQGIFETFDRFEIQNQTITQKQAQDILACQQTPLPCLQLQCRKFLFVYGFVEYIDPFQQITHTSRFAYCYRFNYYRNNTGDSSDFREPVGFPSHWEYN
jgi:hypothetical protein